MANRIGARDTNPLRRCYSWQFGENAMSSGRPLLGRDGNGSFGRQYRAKLPLSHARYLLTSLEPLTLIGADRIATFEFAVVIP